MTRSVLVVAGEVSGDMHAAALVRAVRARRPDVTFFGIGGDQMRAAGVETVRDASEMAVTGFTEVVSRLRFFRRVFFETLDLARTRRPDAVLLVDYPGFNLRFAARAHAAGLPTIYYICPQVWAWNRGRIPRMARVIDRLITIFPFEAGVFRGTGLRVDFAGNPLVDEARELWARPPAPLPWAGEPRVALLPGSRDHEIELILPPMWRAAALIEREHPGAGFILPAPNPAGEQVLRRHIARQGHGGPTRWAVVVGQAREALRQARAALVASGTATVEASLMRCPHVLAYRARALTYILARLVIRTRWIGMVNVMAGREVCPEFIQGGCTAEALAAAINPLLADTPRRAAMLADLDAVNRSLGPGDAVNRAAGFVLEELNRHHHGRCG